MIDIKGFFLKHENIPQFYLTLMGKNLHHYRKTTIVHRFLKKFVSADEII
jgi:hypothetical protein